MDLPSPLCPQSPPALPCALPVPHLPCIRRQVCGHGKGAQMQHGPLHKAWWGRNPESGDSALGRKRGDRRLWEGGAQTPGREEPRPPVERGAQTPGEREPRPPRRGRSPGPGEGGAQTPEGEPRPPGRGSPDPPGGGAQTPGQGGEGSPEGRTRRRAEQRSPGRSGRGASWVRLSGGEDTEATSPHPFPGGRAAPGAGPRSGAQRARSARRLPKALGADAAETASRLL